MATGASIISRKTAISSATETVSCPTGTLTTSSTRTANIVKRLAIAGGIAETDYTWDNRNRLVDVAIKDTLVRTWIDVALNYDMFDRLIGRTETINSYTGSSTTPSSSTTSATHFVFDGQNAVARLRRERIAHNSLSVGPGLR